MTAAERDACLGFLRAAGALKDTLRSGWTQGRRAESTAEHTWRLCLMAVALEDELRGVDLKRLLQLLVVHDLGEAVGGDIPAPMQAGDKTAGERADFLRLIAGLPAAGGGAAPRALGRVQRRRHARGAARQGARPAGDGPDARGGGEPARIRLCLQSRLWPRAHRRPPAGGGAPTIAVGSPSRGSGRSAMSFASYARARTRLAPSRDLPVGLTTRRHEDFAPPPTRDTFATGGAATLTITRRPAHPRRPDVPHSP